MSRKTAKDFDPEVLSLFDKYVHGRIDRRGFLEGAATFAVGGLTAAGLLEALSPNFASFAVGGLTAAGLLEALSPNFAEAQQVASNDARIKVSYVDYASKGNDKVHGYLAQPAKA